MTKHACEPTSGGPIKALLAARRPAAADKEWADVTTSAAGALALWRRQRHTHVLADFGPLACGTTGLQLARRIRAEDPDVLVFLLSGDVRACEPFKFPAGFDATRLRRAWEGSDESIRREVRPSRRLCVDGGPAEPQRAAFAAYSQRLRLRTRNSKPSFASDCGQARAKATRRAP